MRVTGKSGTSFRKLAPEYIHPQPEPNEGEVKLYDLGEPLPSQSRFLNSQAKYVGFSGPIGSGKSRALVWKALQMVQSNPGCLGLIGAQSYKMIHDVTQRAFFSELNQLGVPYIFNKQNESFILPEFENAQVIFRHLDDPDMLRGLNLAWFGLDELTLTGQETWKILEGRLREGRIRCGFAAWTPRGKNWVYETFGLHQWQAGLKRILWKEDDQGRPIFETILAQPGENKHLPRDYYSGLAGSYDERLYRQEVLAEYINLYHGEVYHFSQDANVRPCPVDPHLPLCVSLDFNLNPMTAVIAQIHDPWSPTNFIVHQDRTTRENLRYLEVVDELFLKNSNTSEMCQSLLAKLDQFKMHHPISVALYGDPAGNQKQRASVGARNDWELIWKILGEQTQVPIKLVKKVRDADPGIKERVGAVNKMLRAYDQTHRLFIDPKCKMLIKDLEQVVWEEGTDRVQIRKGNSEVERMLTHISDALAYLCEKEFGSGGSGGYRSETLY